MLVTAKLNLKPNKNPMLRMGITREIMHEDPGIIRLRGPNPPQNDLKYTLLINFSSQKNQLFSLLFVFFNK